MIIDKIIVKKGHFLRLKVPVDINKLQSVLFDNRKYSDNTVR